MNILYDIAYLFLFVLYAPVLFLKGKLHSGYRMRCGLIPDEIVRKLKGKRTLWFHAVSVGEVIVLKELVQKLKNNLEGHHAVLTVVTQTGYDVALQHFKEDAVLYAPLDLSLVIRRFIRVINPKIYIAAETEIWPNLYRKLSRHGVPIVQVNGRISDKSFKGYKRAARLTQRILRKIDMFCMQSDLDARRIIEIGASADKVHVIGNIKFDNLDQGGEVNKTELGYAKSDAIFIAGSTHPGEEEIVLRVFEDCQGRKQDLRLIISPRHIERVDHVCESVRSAGMKPKVLSDLKTKPLKTDEVLVVNEIGVLRDLYSIADYVFIGKTLTVGGGQNMIEPASYGKPVLTGPLTANFKDVMRIFLAEDAIIQVEDEKGLLAGLHGLIEEPTRREQLGKKARAVVEKYQGATDRTLELILPLVVPS